MQFNLTVKMDNAAFEDDPGELARILLELSNDQIQGERESEQTMKNETIQTPSGPQVVRVYDNGGESFDRYTVYFMDRAAHGFTPEYIRKTGRDFYPLLGMSGDPFWPQGFCQHSDGKLGKHNGKRIAFASLPLDCQQAVMQDFPAKLYECGICSCLHPWDWNGDCRDDANRYADAEDYGERNKIARALWANGIEVVPMSDRLAADAGEDAPEVGLG